jgi:hypothetical protein
LPLSVEYTDAIPDCWADTDVDAETPAMTATRAAERLLFIGDPPERSARWEGISLLNPGDDPRFPSRLSELIAHGPPLPNLILLPWSSQLGEHRTRWSRSRCKPCAVRTMVLARHRRPGPHRAKTCGGIASTTRRDGARRSPACCGVSSVGRCIGREDRRISPQIRRRGQPLRIVVRGSLLMEWSKRIRNRADQCGLNPVLFVSAKYA